MEVWVSLSFKIWKSEPAYNAKSRDLSVNQELLQETLENQDTSLSLGLEEPLSKEEFKL